MKTINPPAEPMANVVHRTYFSERCGCEVGFNVFLPDGYGESGKAYPVVYHLHGWTGNESSELRAMERLCRSREAVTVFPNHSPVTAEVQTLPFAPVLFEELIPLVEAEYRVIPGREDRSVSGFSMGGGMAASFAFRYPEMFSAVAAYAGTYHHYFAPGYSTVGEPAERAAEIYRTMMAERKPSENNILQRLSCGADGIRGKLRIELRIGTEDVLYCDNEILRMHLEALGIPHEYIRASGAGHALEKLV